MWWNGSTWADWDKQGHLLYGQGGKLFRLIPSFDKNLYPDMSNMRELADFSDLKFTNVPPPESALKW